MKKSLLAILISSIVLLTACDDKENQAKWQQAEQKILQLQTELKTTQDELAKVRSEIPVIFTKEIEIFNKLENFKNPQKEEEYISESVSSMRITAVDTNVQWLNDLLYRQMLGDYDQIDNNAKKQELQNIPDLKKRLQALAAYNYEIERQLPAQFETRANEYEQRMRYIGQHHNVMTFQQDFYVDGGGAHPNGWTNYINIDANKKAIIDLEMLFGVNNLPMLKELLWDEYKVYNAQQNDMTNEKEFYTQKENFVPSNDFYFSINGITFVYAAYAIGPYAAGPIELFLSWEMVNSLVKPEYVW